MIAVESRQDAAELAELIADIWPDRDVRPVVVGRVHDEAAAFVNAAHEERGAAKCTGS